MIETQAAADMLLMTHSFSAGRKEEPVEVAVVRAVLAGERSFARLYVLADGARNPLARVPRGKVDDLVRIFSPRP